MDWEKAGVPQPLACSIDLTESCNLACEYCFTQSSHESRHLTFGMAKRILDWWLPQTVGQDKPVQVTAWGGEPLLRWSTWKLIVDYCNRKAEQLGIKNIEYGGTTNGILYSPDKVEWTMKNKSLFMFSHDGVKPAHNLYRKTLDGKGSFDKVDRNLRLAKEVCPDIRSRMTLSVANLPYFFESVQYFVEEIGLKHIAFSPVFEDQWNDYAFGLLEGEFKKIIRYAVKKYKEGVPFTLKHLNDIATQNTPSSTNPCGAGRQYMGWSIDGYGFPCHRFNKHGRMPIHRERNKVVIARPKGRSFEWCNRQWLKTFDFVESPPDGCRECKLLTLSCGGGCYAVNHDMTGDIRVQHVNVCRFNMIQHDAGIEFKALAEEAGVVLEASGWNQQKSIQQKSCICYNMCYSEGTQQEILHIDRSTDMMCECYMTNYSGRMGNGPTRTLKEKYKLLRSTVPLVRKIYATRDQEKTKEEIELENKLLTQFFEHLTG